MYNSKFQIKENLTIEIIKHNGIIVISNNYNKIRFIDYTVAEAINQFKKTYKQEV